MRSDELDQPAPGAHPHVEGLDGTGSDMSRIISVSDAVFAFSMTFLVIDLILPQRSNGVLPGLGGYFQNEWSSIAAYLLSFFIILTWWRSHRRLFSPIARYDDLLVTLNSFFLLIIAITPFLVGILYDYGPSASNWSDLVAPGAPDTRLAVTIYASVQLLGGLILLAIWRHSTRAHHLVERSLPAEWIRFTERNQLATVAVFAISIPIAQVAPLLAMVAWIAVVFGFRRILRRHSPARRGPPSDRSTLD